LLATNAWIAGAELDLVARRGRTVVFCEVKSKSGPRYGDPLEMVTAEKVRRLRRAAAAWLARHPQQGRLVLRFDVVSVRPGRTTCLKNAF
jgi:putative endonuclease